MGTQHLVLGLDLVEREEEGAATDKQLGNYRLRARMQQTGCGECVAALLLSQRSVLLGTQAEDTAKSHVCLALSTALDTYLFGVGVLPYSPHRVRCQMRHELMDTAVYLDRHIDVTHQRVERLAPLERYAVTSPLGTVNGQDGTKDEFCVRLTSTWFNQDACLGV